MRIEGKVSRTSLLALCVALVSPIASHALGEPDPSAPPITLTGANCAGALAASTNGSIFAYATAFDGSGRVYKLKADGSLDASWGGSGWVPIGAATSGADLTARPDGSLLAFRAAQGTVLFSPTGNAGVDYPTSGYSGLERFSAFQPDGSLVAYTLLTPLGPGPSSFRFTRFAPDGHVDTSFGIQGTIDVPNLYGQIYAWSLLPDGSLEIGTLASDVGTIVPRLRRYGTSAGLGASDVPGGRLLPQAGIASSIAPWAATDAQGNVYFAVDDVSMPPYIASKADIRLIRFSPDGQPDATFGGGNNAIFPFAGITTTYGFTYPKALWRSSTGEWNVVLAATRPAIGSMAVVETSTRLVRYTSDGRPDPQFAQSKVIDEHSFWPVARLVDGRLVHMTGATGCTIEHALGDPPAESTMVEYYKASADHYFMTLEGGESVLLDETPAGAGWARTGRSFGAWSTTPLDGTKRLCRFYGDLRGGPDSHFYTPEGAECDGLRTLDAATPQGQYAWRFEGYAASVVVPVNGACPVNLAPVYRLYNRGFEKGGVPNHRYTVDASLYADMQAKGWAGEGIAFCVPPAPNNLSY